MPLTNQAQSWPGHSSGEGRLTVGLQNAEVESVPLTGLLRLSSDQSWGSSLLQAEQLNIPQATGVSKMSQKHLLLL